MEHESVIDMATFEGLKDMVGEDFIAELVGTFFEEAPRLISDLQTSLQAGDAPAFTRAAHSLKSNSASFGANTLAAQAREIEMLGRAGELEKGGVLLAALEESYSQVEEALRTLLL